MPPPRRVLFLLQPGTNSRQILTAILQGFEDAGHAVQVCELAQVWQPLARLTDAAQRRELLTQFANAVGGHIRAQKIDLVVSMWANGIASFPLHAHPTHPAKAQSFLEAIGVPHLCYWLDAPHWASDGQALQLAQMGALAGDRTYHAINNEATAREMREVLGMPRSRGFAYAISPRQYAPPAERCEIAWDVAFQLGPGDGPPTPAMLAALESDEPDLGAIRAQLSRDVEHELAAMPGLGALASPLVRGQHEHRGRPMLQRLHALGAEDPALAAPVAALLGDAATYVRATALVRRIDSWYRAFTFAWLDRRFRCVCMGGEGLAGWPIRGYVLPFEPDLAKVCTLYASARCGLSVMRWQDDVGLHLKPFEIAAAGAPCLAMRRPGLDQLFTPGEDVLAFDTMPEAKSHVDRLRDDPALRDRVAQSGLARVRGSHQWKHRVDEMLAWIFAG